MSSVRGRNREKKGEREKERKKKRGKERSSRDDAACAPTASDFESKSTVYVSSMDVSFLPLDSHCESTGHAAHVPLTYGQREGENRRQTRGTQNTFSIINKLTKVSLSVSVFLISERERERERERVE